METTTLCSAELVSENKSITRDSGLGQRKKNDSQGERSTGQRLPGSIEPYMSVLNSVFFGAYGLPLAELPPLPPAVLSREAP